MDNVSGGEEEEVLCSLLCWLNYSWYVAPSRIRFGNYLLMCCVSLDVKVFIMLFCAFFQGDVGSSPQGVLRFHADVSTWRCVVLPWRLDCSECYVALFSD